jgi:hypothetical protein
MVTVSLIQHDIDIPSFNRSAALGDDGGSARVHARDADAASNAPTG